MGLLENHVAVRMATLQDLTTSNEPLSPPRIQKWNTAVHPVISNSPRSARAIAIGIGDEESVAKLQSQMDTHHMLALREIANLAIRFYGSPRGEKTMTDALDMPKHIFIKWMTHDPSNQPITNLGVFRTFIIDTTSQICISEDQKADSTVPALKPLTAEAAIKIISPNGVAGAVNVIVHEHTLDAVYQALRYVQRTDIIAESDKSAWAMVVLQLTGMDSVAGLENNCDYLRKATELNCKKHENNAWSLRAKNFSDQYETAQTSKFFQKAISKGMISDPSKVEEVIRSTPANTKERLQNMDQAFLNVETKLQNMDQAFLNVETKLQNMDQAFLKVETKLQNMDQAFLKVETKLQNIDKAFKIQQQFNTAIAVGLVVSGISFGISLFRISIRLEGLAKRILQ